MRQIIFVIRKELKTVFREKLFIFLSITIAFLLGISFYAGFVSNKQQRTIIEQKQKEKREEWLNQGDKHPHIAAHYGTFVFKPKTILSLFDNGLDAFTGTSVYLEAHYQHEFMFRPAQDHSSMIRFGELSASLVIQILMPLLIIFLCFNAFTRERESGTLKILLSQGISYGTIAWGKILAYLSALSIILLPFLVGFILFTITQDRQSTIPDIETRAILLILFYGIYLFFFVVLSVWVSIWSSNGRNALLTLLSIWILLVIIVPKTISNFSESFYPLPSMQEFKSAVEKDKSNGLEGIANRSVRLANLEKEYLDKYDVDSVHKLPLNFEGLSMQAGEEYGNLIYDHHQKRLRELFDKQNRLGSTTSLFNPFISIQHLSMALAGTDTHTFTDFEEKVETYRRDLVRKMNMDMAMNSKYGEFYGYKADSELWNDIEDFSYHTPFTGEVLGHYRLEIVSLILWLVLVLTALTISNKKLRPTHG